MRRCISRAMVPAIALSLSLWLALGCSQAPKVASPEEFYRGSTVDLIVSSGAGSSTDLLARAFAPYLAKEIGATVKVEDMGPDEGLNYVYAQAKRDGLTIVVNSSNATLSNDILKAPGVQYETEKFNFLADVSPSSTVFEISPKLPHKTIDALRQARGLKIGSTTAKGAIAISGAVAAEILGLDGKVISGYGGKKDLTLAVARGEVDIMVTSDSTAMKDEKDGYVVNLFTLGSKRSPAIPDVPSMTELGASPPKDLEAALAYVSAGGMSVALPPEVAPERVDYLRNAFQRLGEDKEVQKDIEQVTGIWRPFVSGKDLQDTVSTIKANNGLAGQLDEILAKRKATQ